MMCSFSLALNVLVLALQSAAAATDVGGRCIPWNSTGIDFADANISVVPSNPQQPSTQCCKLCTLYNEENPDLTQCTASVWLRDANLCTLKATALKPIHRYHVQ
eukprot:gene28668-26383_t